MPLDLQEVVRQCWHANRGQKLLPCHYTHSNHIAKDARRYEHVNVISNDFNMFIVTCTGENHHRRLMMILTKIIMMVMMMATMTTARAIAVVVMMMKMMMTTTKTMALMIMMMIILLTIIIITTTILIGDYSSRTGLVFSKTNLNASHFHPGAGTTS